MTRPASTKIKIERRTLITKLKESKATHKAAYDKALTKYETEHPKYADKVATALRKMADKIQATPEVMYDNVSYSKYSGTVTVPIEKINMPEKPWKQDTDNLDRMIRVLESSCEEFIMVSIGDDYSTYL